MYIKRKESKKKSVQVGHAPWQFYTRKLITFPTGKTLYTKKRPDTVKLSQSYFPFSFWCCVGPGVGGGVGGLMSQICKCIFSHLCCFKDTSSSTVCGCSFSFSNFLLLKMYFPDHDCRQTLSTQYLQSLVILTLQCTAWTGLWRWRKKTTSPQHFWSLGKSERG